MGKLSKDTSEQDLRDHFTNFGYVMDVFVPRAKENKKEHRGFGFVTFETEAAIQVNLLQVVALTESPQMLRYIFIIRIVEVMVVSGDLDACAIFVPQRVVSHGTHKIKNHAVAIDVAVPEESGSVCDAHK